MADATSVLLVGLAAIAAAAVFVWRLLRRPEPRPPTEIDPPLPPPGALESPTLAPAPYPNGSALGVGPDRLPTAAGVPRAAPAPAVRQTLSPADLPPFDIWPRRKTIGMAVRHGWAVEIVYCDSNGEWTSRMVTPNWMGGTESAIYQEDRFLGGKRFNADLFGGYCYLRRQERTFRFDRVRAIEVLHDKEHIRQRYRVI